MFAVIYKIHISPDKELVYQQLWHQVAQYFIKYRGAISSSLHKTNDGYYLAYSRWPDKQTRDASWSLDDQVSVGLPQEILQCITQMKACADLDKYQPEIIMEVIDELS